jgi:hypothetical protein
MTAPTAGRDDDSGPKRFVRSFKMKLACKRQAAIPQAQQVLAARLERNAHVVARQSAIACG